MWDKRYDTDTYVYGTKPSRFLKLNSQYLKKGDTVLAVADGEGRNSVFMAEQGLNVTAMDSSQVGMAKARQLAADRGVDVNFQLADLRGYDWDILRLEEYEAELQEGPGHSGQSALIDLIARRP